LRVELPAAAEALTPPTGADSVLGASAEDFRSFALDGLNAG
jgi:hypothetical protein